MNVLITGGFGFLGGRLAQHLHGQGHTVSLGSRHNAVPPAWLPSATVVHTRWDSAEALQGICLGNQAVVHAAGINAHDCAQHPARALDFNGVATARLVHAAANAGVKRLVYLSTAHVYSSPLEGVLTEDTQASNPHPYATSHLAGEDAVLAASRRGDIEGVVVRLPNAFGEAVHPDVNCWGLLVNDLCRQAVVNRTLLLRTSGTQERDFIPIQDVNLAVERLLEVQRERLGDGLFNVGSGRAMTVLDMARFIRARCEHVLGYEPGIQTNPHANEDVQEQLEFKIDKIQQLGWTPTSDFSAEIDRTLVFCEHAWSGTP